MDSTPHSRDSAWFDELYSDALERATEFSDSYLDNAFAEISVRLNAIRLGSKPALTRAVTEGQLIQLEHLLPELEYSDGGDDGALDIAYPEIESGTQNSSLNTASNNDYKPDKIDELDYSDLYDELEYDLQGYQEPLDSELTGTTSAVSELIKSFSKRQESPDYSLADLPLCEVNEQRVEEYVQQEAIVSNSTVTFEAVAAPKFEIIHEQQAEKIANSDTEPTEFVLQEPNLDDGMSDHSESELLFEAVNDEQHDLADFTPHEYELTDQVDDEADKVSRIPNAQAPVAIQAGNNLLQVDPAGIAQALVEMYLENERILNAQREEQRVTQARQKRQFRLIAAIATAAVLIVCAAVIVYINVSKEPSSNTAEVSATLQIPPPATAPLLPYQSVNSAIALDETISGEVRTPLNQQDYQNAHPAEQVGADEFNYYDDSLYEPDSYADADTEYYPEAIGDSSVVVEKRDGSVTLHEKAYAQWHAGDVEAAKQAYLKILAGNAEDTEALVGLGSMAQRQGNNVAAVDYLVRAVKIQPDHAYALAALASLSTTANRAQLENDLMNLARDNPDIAELPFILGNWYARDKRWSDAQQAYFDAYNRNTNNADYAYNLAIALDQIGKSKTAESYYRKAISLAPGANTHFDLKKARARADQLARS